MKRKVAIVGAGMTSFGEHFNRSLNDLMQESYLNALKSVDEGIAPKKEIQAGWFGTYQSTECGFPMADATGLVDIPVTRVENACGSGSDALRNAWFAVAAGVYDVVLVLGAEKMTDAGTSVGAAMPMNLVELGRGWMVPFALLATRHMFEFGLKREHLAMVSVKNHHNGKLNPRAHFRFETTVDEVLKSRMICYPLTLYDSCPRTDGAAAVIICRADLAKKYTDTPTYITGLGQSVDVPIGDYEQLVGFPAIKRASKEAYEMAGIKSKDINVAELHDCFSITELIIYEELGFCKRGEAKKLIEEGVTALDGEIPCNTSGGLLSKGHPIGATGLAQSVEIFEQLRGQSGERQVSDAEIGLQTNIGVDMTGNISVVTIQQV